MFHFTSCEYSDDTAPKVMVKHHRNDKNLAEIQVTNQKTEKLICYVAIDGYKHGLVYPIH